MKKYNVAILGSTGMVGHEFLKILDQRNFPINTLKLTASERTSGTKIQFQGKEYEVEVTTQKHLKELILFFLQQVLVLVVN
jgi:aspartate-semialdehyde dehydrogenase